jgi:hypothetical protein
MCRQELKGCEGMDAEHHRQYLLMLYDQCLCCFRHHAEVWVSLAQLEMTSSGATAARTIFREGIEVVPSSALLRIAFAEMEEQFGTLDTARDVLDASFQAVPSALMFSAYQRFLRRNDGVNAARRIFSEYIVAIRKTDQLIDSGVSDRKPLSAREHLIGICGACRYVRRTHS